MSSAPPTVAETTNDEVQHKVSKVVSDTPNGTHSVESTRSGEVEQQQSEASALAPQEHSHNGVVCGEESTSSAQEVADSSGTMEERKDLVGEEDEKNVTNETTPTLPPSLPPQPSSATTTHTATVALPSVAPVPGRVPAVLTPPQPPSLVQSSAVEEREKSDGKSTVRTAPPALVGYDVLDKQSVSDEGGSVGEGEAETNEESSMDVQQSSRNDSPDQTGNDNNVAHGNENKNSAGSAIPVVQLQRQQRGVREESPTLVIDMGSQHEQVGEDVPLIREPETKSHVKDKQVDVSSSGSSLQQVSAAKPATIEEPASPQSNSSSNEDVDIDMDIIEEGEETPPPAPPPKGVLMKPPTSTIAAQAHQIHSLSSSHPRIGVSPSHTASCLAMENFKKNSADARKPNVIVASPASGISTAMDLSRGGGGNSGSNNPNKEGGGGAGGIGELGKDRQSVVTDNFRVRQVAKVKQFFTTLQQFGNKNGSEVAEQVQELITAVVNETASVEEFHQEVQSALNFPLKDFIIPFLKENLKHLRSELKESSHSLSELLGDDGPIPDTIGLTPQLVDDELPVLPSSSQASGPVIRAVGSSVITQSHQSSSGNGSSAGATPSPTVSKATPSRSGHTTSVATTRTPHQSAPTSGVLSSSTAARGHHQQQQHGTGTGTVVTPHSQSTIVLDGAGTGDGRTDYVSSVPPVAGMQRKRARRASIENRSSGLEKEISTDRDRQLHSGHMPKRPRSDHAPIHTYGGGDSTVTTQAPLSHLHPSPLYPQPPPIHSITSTAHGIGEGGAYLGALPVELGGSARKKTLTEDWGHVQMMLSSIQGMVERARQAMALLRDRVNATQTELEKRELERDTLIKQRVSEAVDKVKRQFAEDKQRLVLEANNKLRETVAAARNELESRMAQTQSLAVQEALKEANAQSNSKENCWNCGRRATETCSGCNKARYCGTFCQHKDWANHMHHCASGIVSQSNAVEETYERRDNIRHHQPIALATNEVTLVPAGRGGAPIRQAVAIPLNMVPGNEMNVHGIPARIPHSHTDIAVTVVKTEKV